MLRKWLNPVVLAAVVVVVVMWAGAMTACVADTGVIPLTADSWDVFGYQGITPILTQVPDGIQFYGSAYRGDSVLQSKAQWDLTNATVYLKWQANGGGTFMAVSPAFWQKEGYEYWPSGVYYGGSFSTGNQYGSTTLISENTWYYSRITFDAVNGVTGVTATQNYDNRGGAIVQTFSWYGPFTRPFTPTDIANLQHIHVGLELADVYAGTSAWAKVGQAIVTHIPMPTPPPPPPISPLNPPPQLTQYSFVIGVKPSLQFTPLTVGANFELDVPCIPSFQYNPSVRLPKDPITPDIPALQYAFHTNNVVLGSILNSITPWHWNSSLGVDLGVKGGIEGSFGLIMKDGDSTAKVGGSLDLGVNFFVDANIPSLKALPGIGAVLPSTIEFEVPIAGIPPITLAGADIPIGSLFSYSAWKQAISAETGIPLSGLTGSTTIAGIPITFDDANKEVTIGIKAEATLFAKTSALASIDAYLQAAGSGTNPVQSLSQLVANTWGQSTPLSVQSCIVSSTGTSTIDATGGLKMTTGSPVWVIDPITLTSKADCLVFDAQFDGNYSGAGLLSVYMDGQLVVLIDEAQAGTGLETYVLALPTSLDPGEHLLSFRMDPESDAQASLYIDNVSMGFADVPEPTSLAMLTIGGLVMLRRRK